MGDKTTGDARRRRAKQAKQAKLRRCASAWHWADKPGCLDAAIDRILKAVAETAPARTDTRAAKRRKYALNVDRGRVVEEMKVLSPKWLVISTWDSEFEPTAVARRAELFHDLATSAKKLKKDLVTTSAKNLKKQLLAETGQQYVARQIAWFPTLDFKAFLDGLEHVIVRAETFEQLYKRQGKWGRWLNRPPKEWFVAKILPFFYERWFGQEAGIGIGPYSRFAVAVMRELGAPIKQSNVVRALKDVNDPSRPRRRKQTPSQLEAQRKTGVEAYDELWLKFCLEP
jgi:hypothetical protein